MDNLVNPITGEVFEGDQGLTDAYRSLKELSKALDQFKADINTAIAERYKHGDELKNGRAIKRVERTQYYYPYSRLQEVFDADQMSQIVKPSITKIRELATPEQMRAVDSIREVDKITTSYKII